MPHPEKASYRRRPQAEAERRLLLFVADYTGLKVAQFAELRNRLRRRRPLPRRQEHLPAPRGQGSRPARTRRTEGPDRHRRRRQGRRRRRQGSQELHRRIQEADHQDRHRGPPRRLGRGDQTIADLPSREVLLASLLGVLIRPRRSSSASSTNRPPPWLASSRRMPTSKAAAAAFLWRTARPRSPADRPMPNPRLPPKSPRPTSPFTKNPFFRALSCGKKSRSRRNWRTGTITKTNGSSSVRQQPAEMPDASGGDDTE